jgi:hypothetical protein
MRSILLVLLPVQPVVAATFMGQAAADFGLEESLNGSHESVSQRASVTFTLTTDYKHISWAFSYDVDLLMAGGPDKPFETRLKAKGVMNTLTPSPLTFPNEFGFVGGGNYALQGTAEWSMSERIVTATDSRASAPKAIAGSGQHRLSVRNYPEYIELSHGILNSQSTFDLGRINTGGANNFVRATMRVYDQQIRLTDLLPGDFASNGSVGTDDYVLWRDSPLPLGPFLTSYDSWKANFGDTLSAGNTAGSGGAIPEPGTEVCALAGSILALPLLRNRARLQLASSK